jgi:hypothetical protein
VTSCAATVAVTYALTVHDPVTTGVPLAWPTLRIAPFLATLVAALPAVLTPEVPGAETKPVAAAALQKVAA